jgi:hypothetical protein
MKPYPIQALLTLRLVSGSEQPTYKAATHVNRQGTFRSYFTQSNFNTLLIILLLFAFFRDPIINILNFVVLYLFGQRDNIVSNLISNVIWFVLAFGVGEGFRRLVKKSGRSFSISR